MYHLAGAAMQQTVPAAAHMSSLSLRSNGSALSQGTHSSGQQAQRGGTASSTSPLDQESEGRQMVRDAIPRDQTLLRMSVPAREIPSHRHGAKRRKGKGRHLRALGTGDAVEVQPGPLTLSMRQQSGQPQGDARAGRAADAESNTDSEPSREPTPIPEAGTGEPPLEQLGGSSSGPLEKDTYAEGQSPGSPLAGSNAVQTSEASGGQAHQQQSMSHVIMSDIGLGEAPTAAILVPQMVQNPQMVAHA